VVVKSRALKTRWPLKFGSFLVGFVESLLLVGVGGLGGFRHFQALSGTRRHWNVAFTEVLKRGN
jgi:hypothetical protein